MCLKAVLCLNSGMVAESGHSSLPEKCLSDLHAFVILSFLCSSVAPLLPINTRRNSVHDNLKSLENKNKSPIWFLRLTADQWPSRQRTTTHFRYHYFNSSCAWLCILHLQRHHIRPKAKQTNRKDVCFKDLPLLPPLGECSRQCGVLPSSGRVD